MKAYSEKYECDECPEVFSSAKAAAKCCGTGDYSVVFQCDRCKTIHAVPEFAARCCPNGDPVAKPAERVEPISQHREAPVVRIPASATRIVRPPQPDCDYCGIAQKFGRVISCICMKD